MFEKMRAILRDLRYFVLFPKRYKKPIEPAPEDYKQWAEYWRGERRRAGNLYKKMACSCSHWHVVTYKDGRQELAFFWTIPPGFSCRGSAATLYRGLLWPRIISAREVRNYKSTRIAF